jgi:hypothetical protein
MNTKDAKDFLVQQATEQAALEGVSLSDLERRMMYFVENDETSCADPLALNEEFEAQYDSADYEAKMGRLLRHAYKRLKTESPQRIAEWDDAIHLLSKGDHYLPVLWNTKPAGENRWRDIVIMMVGIGLLIVAGIVIWDFWLAK